MLTLSTGLTVYILTVTAALGLVMGSFLNCYAWRLANGESILRGRSHCTACGKALGPADLVPVFSYLFLRGRCRHCGAKISPRYPATELLCAVVFVSVVLRYDVTPRALTLLLLCAILLTASLVDLESGIIPDRLILAGIGVFLIFSFFEDGPVLETLGRGLFGALAVTLPLLLLVLLADKVLKRDTMGGGDIKLIFMIGLFFDWQQNLLLLIAACILGLLLALILGKARPNTQFPFGPALAGAAWLVMLFGRPVLDWYLSLFLLA